MLIFKTLFYKEILRFYRTGIQTIMSPVITSLIYILIFGHVLKKTSLFFYNLNYIDFLIPGLIMMNLLQNSFSNSSSSLIQSKVAGNIIFIYLSPITFIEIFLSYILASVIRGLIVSYVILFILLILEKNINIIYPIYFIIFSFLGGIISGILGFISGILAKKIDHLIIFQNVIINPLTILAGVFYTKNSLPIFWQNILHFNPFFYIIDGFRYSFLGLSEINPLISIISIMSFLFILILLSILIIKIDNKIKI